MKHHRLTHKNLNPFCLALQAKRSATYFTVQNTFVLCCHFVLAEKEQTVKPLAEGIIKIASSPPQEQVQLKQLKLNLFICVSEAEEEQMLN